MSTRAGGVSRGAFARLNLGLGTQDEADRVAENRGRLASALGVERVVFPHQVHGDAVRTVVRSHAEPGRCDALVAAEPHLAVGVLGADCPGVLLVDPLSRVLAVVHAGWRGVAGGVLPRTLLHLEREHGVASAALHAAIGPGIGAARYEVDQHVAERIRRAFGRPEAAIHAGRPGHAHVDLQHALELQLLHAGVAPGRVERFEACTYDDERFFSHRRDAGRTGRHALVAAWVD